MRRILRTILILIMLMPSLACGPFMAAGEAQAAPLVTTPAQTVSAEILAAMSTMPCHEAPVGDTVEESNSHATMLFKDCAGVDLMGAAHVTADQPATKIFDSFFGWAAIIPTDTQQPDQSYTIRGPPPDELSALASGQRSLYLTTQRLRL